MARTVAKPVANAKKAATKKAAPKGKASVWASKDIVFRARSFFSSLSLVPRGSMRVYTVADEQKWRVRPVVKDEGTPIIADVLRPSRCACTVDRRKNNSAQLGSL